jgi:hypothetical protein
MMNDDTTDQDEDEEPKMMDLERVTLYRNDFAYYEHMGSGRTVTVRVPKAEKALAMDTFSVQQCPPGRVAMVVDYTEETLEQQKPSIYAFDLGAGKSLGNFLSSCLGTAISLDPGDGTVCRGHLMSVEKTQQVLPTGSNGERVEKKSTTTIQVYEQGGNVRTIDEVTDVRIEDAYMQSQLALALCATLQKGMPVPHGTSDKESIRVSLYDSPTDQRKRTDKDAEEIRVSYVGKSEEWKCSYRMEVPKDDENGKADAPVMLEYVDLQLLGKVRNHSNSDWNDVKLSLVANELELMATKQSLVKPTSSVWGAIKAAHTHGGGRSIYVKALTGKVRVDECVLRV